MKSIVILFDEENKHENKKVFSEKSGKELCFEKYKRVQEKIKSQLNIESEIKFISGCETALELLEKMTSVAKKAEADFIIFSYADLPFLCTDLVCSLVRDHVEYKAEYTFSDGYPYGFAAEIIDIGTAGILSELAKKNQPDLKCSRDCIWNLLKTDINSFDVESIIANDDYRMLRLAFDCGNKDHFTACVKLYEISHSENPDELSEAAKNNVSVLKTVPCFYNLQIEDYVNGDFLYSPYNKVYEQKYKIKPVLSQTRMSLENYSALVKKIADFSENAVISFSLFGEAFHHPEILTFIKNTLCYSGLSVFIETDGLFVNDEICSQLKEIVNSCEKRTNSWPKLMIAVQLDAFTNETYIKIHNVSEGFETAVESIKKLSSVIPGNVYPQFVRMNENEDELEKFYRYWKESSNASGGQLIIQKYDDFCGMLPPCKPADLSPVERNVCWHLRRDMNILSNGNVILCRECVFDNVLGNVFEQELEEIWEKQDLELKNQMECKYNEKCKLCDEFYTFNF